MSACIALRACMNGLSLAMATWLAGCQAAGDLVQDLGNKVQVLSTGEPSAKPAPTRQSDRSQRSTASAGATSRPDALPPTTKGTRNVGKQQAEKLMAYDPQIGVMDITRADGSACRAASDVGMMETAGDFAQLSATLYTTGLLKQVESGAVSDDSLQKSLDEIRPILKQISLHTVWLPIASERYAGEALYSSRKEREFQPTGRDKRIVDEDIVPMFDELRRLAREEIRSDLEFDLRFINDASSRSPEVLSGGIVLIPSGMIQRLKVTKDRRRILAFMLAHEFSHALRRHYTKMIQGNLVDTWTTAGEFKQVVRKDASSIRTISSANVGSLFDLGKQNMERFVQTQCQTRNWYSAVDQRQELEADVCGALLLHRLRLREDEVIDPAAAWASYIGQGFAVRPDASTAGACNVAPSHPDPESRRENLQRYWKALQDSEQ